MSPKDRIQARIERVQIKGFRSLADVDVELPQLTAIIGANGSGKSNFLRFFEMMQWMLLSRKLGEYVTMHGGADDQLFDGNKATPRLEAEIHFRTESRRNEYRFALAYGAEDRFLFTDEAYRFIRLTDEAIRGKSPGPNWTSFGSGHREAKIVAPDADGSDKIKANTHTAKITVDFLRNCQIFQFHDTSFSSVFKMKWDATDTARFRENGGNLAPILSFLRQRDVRRYELICKQIRRILPEFADFELEESYGKIFLRWRALHLKYKTIGAHLTSDGSLRLFALVTLLNLPPEMLPDVILLDEPELGLHPAAVALIGQMIRSLSQTKQVILATQSPLLVDTFKFNEIIVAECHDAKSIFRTLNEKEYQDWLEDGFTPGDLWLKNVIGGRP